MLFYVENCPCFLDIKIVVQNVLNASLVEEKAI